MIGFDPNDETRELLAKRTTALTRIRDVCEDALRANTNAYRSTKDPKDMTADISVFEIYKWADNALDD